MSRVRKPRNPLRAKAAASVPSSLVLLGRFDYLDYLDYSIGQDEAESDGRYGHPFPWQKTRSTDSRPAEDSCFKGLDSLAQCLRRYVDANPSRFAVREENVDATRALIVVLREDSTE